MLQSADDYDFISDIRSYQTDCGRLIDLIMDRTKTLDQHHIKIDFTLSEVRNSHQADFNTLDGPSRALLLCGGVLPVFTPYVNTYQNGVYAFSLGKTKTVYVGANDYWSVRNTVYNRVIRFGRAIYNSEYVSEVHAAGRKYRSLYGETTTDLYLSFLFYSQFTSEIEGLMTGLRLEYSDIERLLIKKFSSKYLLNSIGR